MSNSSPVPRCIATMAPLNLVKSERIKKRGSAKLSASEVHSGGIGTPISSTTLTSPDTAVTSVTQERDEAARLPPFYAATLQLKCVSSHPPEFKREPPVSATMGTVLPSSSTPHVSTAGIISSDRAGTSTQGIARVGVESPLGIVESIAPLTTSGKVPEDTDVLEQLITTSHDSSVRPLKPRLPFHPSKLNRHQLPLDMKIEVIRLSEEQGLSGRSIVELMNEHGFRCGRTQIQNILKNKHEWIEQYAQNVPLNRKRKMRKTNNELVNVKVYEWYGKAVDETPSIGGTMLRHQARKVARELGIRDFKASTGWLEAFKKRHRIAFGKETHRKSLAETDAANDGRQPSFQIPMQSIIQNLSAKKRVRRRYPQMIVGEFVQETKAKRSAKTPKPSKTSSTEINPADMSQVEMQMHQSSPRSPSRQDIICAGDAVQLQRQIHDSQSDMVVHEEHLENGGIERGGCSQKGVGVGVKLARRSESPSSDADVQGKPPGSHPRFTSLLEVAAALHDIRHFFATTPFSHLVDGCLDLEDQVHVAMESAVPHTPQGLSSSYHDPLETPPAPSGCRDQVA